MLLMSIVWRVSVSKTPSRCRTLVHIVPPSVEMSPSPTLDPDPKTAELKATDAPEKLDMSTGGVRSSLSSCTSPSQLLLATANGPVPPVSLSNVPQGSSLTTLHGCPEPVTSDQPGGPTPPSKLSDRPLRP